MEPKYGSRQSSGSDSSIVMSEEEVTGQSGLHSAACTIFISSDSDTSRVKHIERQSTFFCCVFVNKNDCVRKRPRSSRMLRLGVTRQACQIFNYISTFPDCKRGPTQGNLLARSMRPCWQKYGELEYGGHAL